MIECPVCNSYNPDGVVVCMVCTQPLPKSNPTVFHEYGRSKAKLALFNLEDAVLDNAAATRVAKRKQTKKGRKFDFELAQNLEKDVLIPGAKNFIDDLVQDGFKVAFVSQKSKEHMFRQKEHLQQLGIPLMSDARGVMLYMSTDSKVIKDLKEMYDIQFFFGESEKTAKRARIPGVYRNIEEYTGVRANPYLAPEEGKGAYTLVNPGVKINSQHEPSWFDPAIKPQLKLKEDKEYQITLQSSKPGRPERTFYVDGVTADNFEVAMKEVMGRDVDGSYYPDFLDSLSETGPFMMRWLPAVQILSFDYDVHGFYQQRPGPLLGGKVLPKYNKEWSAKKQKKKKPVEEDKTPVVTWRSNPGAKINSQPGWYGNRIRPGKRTKRIIYTGSFAVARGENEGWVIPATGEKAIEQSDLSNPSAAIKMTDDEYVNFIRESRTNPLPNPPLKPKRKKMKNGKYRKEPAKKYVQRFMDDPKMIAEFPDRSQRYAVAMSYAEEFYGARANPPVSNPPSKKKMKKAKKVYKSFNQKDPVEIKNEMVDVGDVWVSLGKAWCIGYRSGKEGLGDEQKYIHHFGVDEETGKKYEEPELYLSMPEKGKPMLMLKGGGWKVKSADGNISWIYH